MLECDGTSLRLNVLAHELGSVCLKTIPDDQRFLADRGLESLQELDYLGRADRVAVESEEKDTLAITESCFQLKLSTLAAAALCSQT